MATIRTFTRVLNGPSKTIRANHHMNIEGFDVNEKYKGDDNMSNNSFGTYVAPNSPPLLSSLPKLPPNGLTSIELFAGGGLMRLGVEHAGITTIWANDFDKGACRAHAYNFGEGSIVQGDINALSIDDIPDADLIIGGPPCQDFSVAGKGEGEEGERGKLVWRYLDIIAAKQPKAFLFENVKGLIGKKHRHTFDALLQRFDEIGYSVSWKLLNSWNYGVAQKRERVFIVGIRKDLGITYVFPWSEYELTGYHPVLRDAIGDLPEPSEYYYVNRQSWKVKNPVQQVFDMDDVSPTVKAQNMPYPPGYIPNEKDAHINAHARSQSTIVKPTDSLSTQRSYVADWEEPARTVNTNRLDHAEIHPGVDNVTFRCGVCDTAFIGTLSTPCPTCQKITDGWELNNHTTNELTQTQYEHSRDHRIGYNDDLDEPSYTIRAKSENVLDVGNHSDKDYWTPKSDYTYDQANRVQRMEPPSATIPAHHNSGQPIHPTYAPRRFTVRECLRIQSVPDTYVFPDDMSLSAMYRVVGNGVPSRVAYHLAVALSDQLLHHLHH